VLKAEQGFREALALDDAHVPTLLGYGALLLSCNRFKEAEVYLQSAVDLLPSALTWGCLALLYELLILSLEDGPDAALRRAEYSRESKYSSTQASRAFEQEQQATPASGDSAPTQVFEYVAKHLIELHQEDIANVCLAKCSSSLSVELLYARLFYQTEQFDESVATLEKLLQQNPQSCEVRMLLGDVFNAMGKFYEAEAQYDAALRIDPFCGSGPSYIRLGNMYVGMGKYKDALSAFITGAKVWPCGLTWLGVGIAYYRIEDMVRAEQALNEANIANNLNPKTWGYLALTCLRQKREDDGDQAFNQAIKQGLSDPHLITEIGVEQLRLGRARIAEASFRRALAINEDYNTHMQLARALCTMKRFDEARDVFRFVAASSDSETQRAKAQEQMSLIP
jgi:tetratricopeptide (TPR) repeat protein